MVSCTWEVTTSAWKSTSARTERDALSCCSMFRSSVEASRTRPRICSISA